MSLDELKKRATASELTLIEATETALREDVAIEVRRCLLEFISNNPPPSREEHRYERNAGSEWLKRLEAHMNPYQAPES